ncbi:MAG: hypothetical protein AAGH99_09470 [Planctomycetota bacterium]
MASTSRKCYAPNYPNEPDWGECEDLLFHKTVSTVDQFTTEYSSANCCFLGYWCDPEHGVVELSLDTVESANKTAVKEQNKKLQSDTRRYVEWGSKKSWETALFSGQQSITPYPDHIGDFRFSAYSTIEFKTWYDFGDIFFRELDESHEDFYLHENEAGERHLNYAESHAVLIFWHVFQKLIDTKALDLLVSDQEFRLGYQCKNWPLLVVNRIINLDF